MLNEVIQIPQERHAGSVSVVHVARLAGVSKSTAAKVFSDRDGNKVHPDTQKKVIEAAERLNYVPNLLARGLRGGSTNTIGIVWAPAGEPATPAMLHEIGTRFSSRGYMATITDKIDRETELKSLMDYANRCVDGIIIQIGPDEQMSDRIISLLRRFKAVMLVSQSPVDVDFDQLIVDRLEGYRSVARHFIHTGRKKIAFATSCLLANKNKYNVFRDEVLNLGTLFSDRNLIDAPTAALREFGTLLESRFGEEFPFDAVMCSNDTIAITLMNWLSRKGYKVPEDVAIVGFDDLELCPCMNPPLASVNRQTGATVEAIEAMIMNRLSYPRVVVQKHVLEMKFVWRESAG